MVSLKDVIDAFKEAWRPQTRVPIIIIATGAFALGMLAGRVIAAPELAYVRLKIEHRGMLLERATIFVDQGLRQEINVELNRKGVEK